MEQGLPGSTSRTVAAAAAAKEEEDVEVEVLRSQIEALVSPSKPPTPKKPKKGGDGGPCITPVHRPRTSQLVPPGPGGPGSDVSLFTPSGSAAAEDGRTTYSLQCMTHNNNNYMPILQFTSSKIHRTTAIKRNQAPPRKASEFGRT
jgi:hypothetical protein